MKCRHCMSFHFAYVKNCVVCCSFVVTENSALSLVVFFKEMHHDI
jgi:hypothetical protein